MNFLYSNNLIASESQTLIENVRNAEACDDFKTCQRLLKMIWSDFNVDPNFDDFNDDEKPALLRICGGFLLKFGRLGGVADFKERGRDLLQRAGRLFEEIEDFENAVESEIILAWSYWLENKSEEFSMFLDSAEMKFVGDELNQVYLQIQVHRLLYYFDAEMFLEAIELIRQIEVSVEMCQNLRVKIHFHIQAGLILRKAKIYEKSLTHYYNAIAIAQNLGSKLSVAIAYNNIAFLFKEQSKFSPALENLELSLKLFKELGDIGWLPHVLDTKAQIFYASGDFKTALEITASANLYFINNQDFEGYVNLLWLELCCLVQLNSRAKAKEIFDKLIDFATNHFGQIRAKAFKNKFYKEFGTYFSNPNLVKKSDIICYKITSAINWGNIIPQNVQNVRFFYVPPKFSSDYFWKLRHDFFLKKEIIIAIERRGIAFNRDILLFETDKGLVVGEYLNKTGVIENSKSNKKYRFDEVFHLGKILGYFPFSEVNQTKIYVREF